MTHNIKHKHTKKLIKKENFTNCNRRKPFTNIKMIIWIKHKQFNTKMF